MRCHSLGFAVQKYRKAMLRGLHPADTDHTIDVVPSDAKDYPEEIDGSDHSEP
jgi:hypothetical protein